MRVFFGIMEIAGYYYRLREGFQKNGVEADFIPLFGHSFQYPFATSRHLIPRLILCLLKKEQIQESRYLVWILRKIIWFICRPLLFLWALFYYDVFIFSYGTTFFNLQDLPLLKKLKKCIIFQFHGSDSRPPYLDGPFISNHSPPDTDARDLIRDKRYQIDRISKWADFIIDTPTAGHFHSKPFVNWLALGLPYLVDENVGGEIINNSHERSIRILHSPSNPVIKGTDKIRKTIEELRNELSDNYEIQFIEITGRPHQEVLDELIKCDIVIDQLYADYGMPGFASEAASFGKPVVIGGYAADYWHSHTSFGRELPTHYVDPESVKDTVRQLIVDKEFRRISGLRHRSFIERSWNAQDVANRYIKMIKGQAEMSWFVDPDTITYVYGCGVEKECLKKYLESYISKFHISGLKLQDKPELASKFERLIH